MGPTLRPCPRFLSGYCDEEGCIKKIIPPWFVLQPPYAEVHLAPECATAWLAAVVQMWKAPPEMLDPSAVWLRWLWAVHHKQRSHIEAALRCKDWDAETGWDLVDTLVSAVNLRLALNKFLPEPYATALDELGRDARIGIAPAELRAALYELALLIGAQAALEAHPDDPLTDPALGAAGPVPALFIRPLLVPGRARYFRLAGDHAEAELLRRARRCDGHVGVNAALALLSGEAARRLGTAIAAEATPALERMERVLVSDPKIRSLLAKLEPELSGKDARQHELAARLIVSLDQAQNQGYVPRDGLELLARAAQGELNFLPKMVLNDLHDEFRRRKRRGRIIVDLRERQPVSDDDDDRKSASIEDLAHPEAAPADRERRELRQLRAQLAQEPWGRRLLQVIAESEPDPRTGKEVNLKALSTQLGWTDDWLRRKIRPYRNDFR